MTEKELFDLLKDAVCDNFKCGECGSLLEPDAKFCGICGWENPLVKGGFI